ncbi:unnamed protein product, partial [Urochloa humidicola]
ASRPSLSPCSLPPLPLPFSLPSWLHRSSALPPPLSAAPPPPRSLPLPMDPNPVRPGGAGLGAQLGGDPAEVLGPRLRRPRDQILVCHVLVGDRQGVRRLSSLTASALSSSMRSSLPCFLHRKKKQRAQPIPSTKQAKSTTRPLYKFVQIASMSLSVLPSTVAQGYQSYEMHITAVAYPQPPPHNHIISFSSLKQHQLKLLTLLQSNCIPI